MVLDTMTFERIERRGSSDGFREQIPQFDSRHSKGVGGKIAGVRHLIGRKHI